MSKVYSDLSKEISYALRHKPTEYGLELDQDGWVDIYDLLFSLNKRDRWQNITLRDIEAAISTSDKKRHEILNNKIRALYGHSIPNKIMMNKESPPNFLYHATGRINLESIILLGLLPMQRQYVHLSDKIDLAMQVGKRKDKNPILLEINTDIAIRHGAEFYFVNDGIWLSNNIHITAIKIMDYFLGG